MTEPDPQAVAEAARLYEATRQRFSRGLWGFFACWIAGALLGLAVKPFYENLAGVLLVPLALSGMFFGLMGFIAQFQFLLIRCPRCGKRCGLTHYSSWTNARCKHCYFRLQQLPELPARNPTSEG